MNKFNTGIYQIVNLINGKRYIGSASFLNKRKENHFNSLKKQKHKNKHLQASYNKYGKETFKFEIILYCDKKNLILYEQKAIDAYDLKKKLYNKRKKAENNLGLKYSEEAKKNMSKAQTGKKQTKETIEKRRKKLIGKKRTEEFKKRTESS